MIIICLVSFLYFCLDLLGFWSFQASMQNFLKTNKELAQLSVSVFGPSAMRDATIQRGPVCLTQR